MNRWWTFIKERFPLGSHFLMILLFVAAHFAVLNLEGLQVAPLQGVIIFIAISLFFFKMRLYDEIKDYEVDMKVNQTRPLPRGLVTLSEVKAGIVFCLIAEMCLFSALGLKASLVFLGAILYSLLMYKEFFIGPLIRPHLTTYAMVHTIVTVPMGLAIFAGISSAYPNSFSSQSYAFLFSSWFLFNIFEFGRKTFSPDEERNQVESYSKIFGPAGAVILVGSMAAASVFLLSYAQGFFSYFQLSLFFGLALFAGQYVKTQSASSAKMYRNFSSVYIVFFYFGFLVELYLRQRLVF